MSKLMLNPLPTFPYRVVVYTMLKGNRGVKAKTLATTNCTSYEQAIAQKAQFEVEFGSRGVVDIVRNKETER